MAESYVPSKINENKAILIFILGEHLNNKDKEKKYHKISK